MTNADRAALDNHLYATMSPRILSAIAEQFVLAIDLGHDVYDPATDTTPAGEHVIRWANWEAARLGFSFEATLILRADVRAVIRRVIRDAYADSV
jgi:hypothetical protein